MGSERSNLLIKVVISLNKPEQKNFLSSKVESIKLQGEKLTDTAIRFSISGLIKVSLIWFPMDI